MITYLQVTPDKLRVKLDGKTVGHIKWIDGGFAYFPRATGNAHGEIFADMNSVKVSIEGERP